MEAKLASIRSQMPAVAQMTYFNTGTAGPLPRPVHQAMHDALDRQLSLGRADFALFAGLMTQQQEARAAIAGLLGCDSTEIALTQSTTEGMNAITLGINWQPGDEAITTTLEHAGALLPLFAARDRFGITLKMADITTQPERAAEIIGDMITSRTRLISVSHVAYTTGAVLPVQEICRVAHQRGVLVLVDGAQSFAAIPVDVRELGCDFYAGPGQKWICGPEGTGLLYGAQHAVSQVRVTYAGYFSVDKYSNHGGMLPKENAQRFEQGTFQPANSAGLLAACRWLTEHVGTDWAFGRIQQLAHMARESLLAVKGVSVLTPAHAAGLIAFQVAGATPDEVVTRLKQEGVVARTVPHPAAVRISTGYYNTEAEVQRVAEVVAAIAGH